MTTVSETALAALATLLQNTYEAGQFSRDPEKAPEESENGIVVMTDGERGEPLITISPLQYEFEHKAELEFSASGTGRNAIVDGLLLKLDAALATNRTLGGTVVDARVMEAPVIEERDQVEGAETIRWALVYVRLEYVTSSPVG